MPNCFLLEVSRLEITSNLSMTKLNMNGSVREYNEATILYPKITAVKLLLQLSVSSKEICRYGVITLWK